MKIAIAALLTLVFSTSLLGQQPQASTKQILKKRRAAIADADQNAVASLVALAESAVKSDASDGIAVATEAWEMVLSIEPDNKMALKFFKMIGRPFPTTVKVQRKKFSQDDGATYTKLPNGKWLEAYDDKKNMYDEISRTPDLIIMSDGNYTQRLHHKTRYFGKTGRNQWTMRTGQWSK